MISSSSYYECIYIKYDDCIRTYMRAGDWSNFASTATGIGASGVRTNRVSLLVIITSSDVRVVAKSRTLRTTSNFCSPSVFDGGGRASTSFGGGGGGGEAAFSIVVSSCAFSSVVAIFGGRDKIVWPTHLRMDQHISLYIKIKERWSTTVTVLGQNKTRDFWKEKKQFSRPWNIRDKCFTFTKQYWVYIK